MHLRKGVSDKLQSEDLDDVSGCERVTDHLAAIKVLQCAAKFESFWKSTLERWCELGIVEPKEDDNPNTAVHVIKRQIKSLVYYIM